MGPEASFDDRLRRRLPRIIAAAVVMGVVLWAMTLILGPALGTPGWRYVALAILVGTGSVAYFATGFGIGAFVASEFRAALRRQR
jgi:putative peptidoglycan lipid II flippase